MVTLIQNERLCRVPEDGSLRRPGWIESPARDVNLRMIDPITFQVPPTTHHPPTDQPPLLLLDCGGLREGTARRPDLFCLSACLLVWLPVAVCGCR